VPQVSIESPILNYPFAEPTRHLRFDEDGITSEIAEGRRRAGGLYASWKIRSRSRT
jgi:type III restriction enzyme